MSEHSPEEALILAMAEAHWDAFMGEQGPSWKDVPARSREICFDAMHAALTVLRDKTTEAAFVAALDKLLQA